MIPFSYLCDAEEWMDENASGSICVLILVPLFPSFGSGRQLVSRCVLEWETVLRVGWP
jgi:hypothetical protein